MRSREMSEEATVSIYYYITTLLRTKMKIPRDPNGAESSSITWQAQRIKTQQNRHHPSIQDERNLARWLGRCEQPLCMVSLPRHSLAGGHLGLSSGVTGILGIKATCQQCRTGREEAQGLRVPGKSQIDLTLDRHKQPPNAINGLCFKMGHSIFLNLSITRGATYVWTPSPCARSGLHGSGSGEPRTSTWGLRGRAPGGVPGVQEPKPRGLRWASGPGGAGGKEEGRAGGLSAQSVPEHRGRACQVRGGTDAEM